MTSDKALYDGLLRDVQRAAMRLAEAATLGRADIERAVHAIDVPPASEPLLELVIGTPRIDAMSVLLSSLVLRRSVRGTPHQDPWLAIFARTAETVIFELRLLGLFDLRLELLDEIITQPPQGMSLAALHFERANTRRVLAGQDGDAMRVVWEDLQIAIAQAQQEGNVDIYAGSIAFQAKLLAGSAEGIPDRVAARAALAEQIREMLATLPALDPFRRMQLLQARAALTRTSRPMEALEALEAAIAMSALGDPLRVEMAAELVSVLDAAGRHEDAISRGLSYLAEPATQDPGQAVPLAMLHLAVGRALTDTHRLPEAREHLSAGLEGVRGRDLHIEVVARLQLAALGLAERDLTLVDEQLQILGDRWAELDDVHRNDVDGLRAGLAALRGDPDAERAALDAAATRASEEPRRTQLLLRRALAAAGHGEDLDALLAHAIELSPDREIEELVQRIAVEYAASIAPNTRARLRAWAQRRGRPSLAARLLHGEGRAAEAVAGLRAAIEAMLLPEEHLRCAHLLVGWLPPDAVDERRARCDDLANLLEQVHDDPHVRFDLASGLHRTARGDLDVLRRAWEHARRALEKVDRPQSITHGERLLAHLAHDIVKATLPASTAEATETAAWLDAERHMPPAQLGPLRLAVASMLLVPGPLMHPRALEVARRLLQRARGDLVGGADREALEALERFEPRLAWIEQRISGRGTAGSLDDGPFDDAPSWLVDLVTGRAPAPAELTAEAGAAIEGARVARPDLDDRLVPLLRRMAGATAPPGDPRRVIDWFHQGVALMREAQGNRLDPDAREKIASARRLLGDAVGAARGAGMAELFDCLVSLGNAWRMTPEEEVERALAAYGEAARLDAPREKRATLWKVHADALHQRGGADDLRRAEELLRQALEVRRDGWLRAETLVSAAKVALDHPDLDEAEQAQQAAEHYMSAVRSDRMYAEPLLHPLVACLTDWSRFRPQDQRPDTYREELRRTYPHRAEEIKARGSEADPTLPPALTRMLSHPAARAVMAIRTRLATQRELRAGMHQFREQLGPAAIQQLEETAKRESLRERPDEAEKVLADLASAQDAIARPGTITGEVLLLAFLARAGRRSLAEVQARTEVAIAEVATVGDPLVQALLLRELACAWSPDDHAADPVRDCSRAAELLRRAVALEGGESASLIDTVGYLARALRYVDDSRGASLRESRRLYRLMLERVRAEGDPDRIANILHNLAEIEAHLGEGDRRDRLVHADQLFEQAAQIARSPSWRASCQASLAWNRTQIGCLGGDDDLTWLERAEDAFELVARDQLDSAARQAFDSHRATCRAFLEKRSGRRPAAIARLRGRLAEVVAAGNPHFIATAQHNLAAVLMFGKDLTAAELGEGLALARKAAAARSVEHDARHNWETTFDAGRALANQLDAGRAGTLPMSRREVWADAQRWLRQAIAAARTLGPGEELAEAGFALSRLAAHAASTEEAVETAEEAWRAVRDAMAFLLTAPAHREREARHALRVANDLARRHANEAVAVASSGLAFMLVGERAEIVERWLLRAQLPTRRPIRAWLARPDRISELIWQEWRAALRAASPRGIIAALERVRTEAPGFLAEDGDLSSITRWLGAHPRGAAVAAFPGGPGLIAWLMTADPQGHLRTCILGLEAPPPPIADEALAGHMADAVRAGAAAHQAQTEMGDWVRRYLAEPSERLLGGPPAAVLWCPGPGLRLIAPAAIWTSSPVSVAAAMEGPDQRAYPSRHRSTLIALADPGPNTPEDLGEHGRRAAELLAAAAEPRGKVRRMGSAGRRFGRALLGNDPGVRDTPASPRDFLLEAAEHDLVVIIAHGELNPDGTAALVCVDRDGTITRLTDDMLADAPESFAGSTVVLLSCSAGQVTSMLADPGGVAGTLVSAGARCVVAPMWPVRIDAATHVAELVLRGSALGEEPPQVLTYIQRRRTDDGPHLGSPVSLEDRRKLDALQHLAFIAWVG